MSKTARVSEPGSVFAPCYDRRVGSSDPAVSGEHTGILFAPNDLPPQQRALIRRHVESLSEAA